MHDCTFVCFLLYNYYIASQYGALLLNFGNEQFITRITYVAVKNKTKKKNKKTLYIHTEDIIIYPLCGCAVFFFFTAILSLVETR